MIDWQVKVQELKQTADELNLWASKSRGRQRTVLGRIADELRRFADQIHRELVPPDENQEAADIPDWLTAIIESSSDVTETDYEEDEEDYYETEEEEWYEDDNEFYEE
ncbi:MAG: hypothetical protein JXB30_00790 [Anaerolineae bacterium]|nr:hypothetical protein [Anaerolineae bacterium]